MTLSVVSVSFSPFLLSVFLLLIFKISLIFYLSTLTTSYFSLFLNIPYKIKTTPK